MKMRIQMKMENQLNASALCLRLKTLRLQDGQKPTDNYSPFCLNIVLTLC